MTKKIFIISSILLLLVIGAIFVYQFAFKKPSVTNETKNLAVDEGKTANTADNNQNASTGSSSASIGPVSDESVFGATLSSDGKYIYYLLGSSGQINQVDFSGKLDRVISTVAFSGIRQVLWNKPKNKLLVRTSTSSGNAKFYSHNASDKSSTPLKDNLDSAAWSNLGDKIIYKYFDPKSRKRTISVSDPDGKNWRDLANFDYVGVEISAVPTSSLVSFWPSANAFTSTSVNTIQFSGENKKEILKDRYGVDVLWSPNGAWAAVSYTDQKGGHKTDLAIMNPDGGQFRTLIFPTFASKCTWSNDSQYLYCALPGDIPETSVLPNDWNENKVSTSDTFWRIEIASGKKERLVDTEKIAGSYDIFRPFLSPDGKTLFFINKRDGKLYKLAL
ncbi:MAG: hypothetical protein WC858_03645 [Parcubacteria group bacterium]|jgi:hypothetical protein